MEEAFPSPAATQLQAFFAERSDDCRRVGADLWQALVWHVIWPAAPAWVALVPVAVFAVLMRDLGSALLTVLLLVAASTFPATVALQWLVRRGGFWIQQRNGTLEPCLDVTVLDLACVLTYEAELSKRPSLWKGPVTFSVAVGRSRHIVLERRLFACNDAAMVEAILAHELGHLVAGSAGFGYSLLQLAATVRTVGVAGLVTTFALVVLLKLETHLLDLVLSSLVAGCLLVWNYLSMRLLVARGGTYSDLSEDAADLFALSLVSQDALVRAVDRFGGQNAAQRLAQIAGYVRCAAHRVHSMR